VPGSDERRLGVERVDRKLEAAAGSGALRFGVDSIPEVPGSGIRLLGMDHSPEAV
jgi:hypothetical protein